MKKRNREASLFTGSKSLRTLFDWVAFALRLYERENVALGQSTDNAYDEVLYLFLATLKLPLTSGVLILRKKLTPGEIEAIKEVLRHRILERTPAAYLTHEAFLGEYRFYVDERVIIPRSYFLEIIPFQLDGWLADPRKVKRVADICTGSGCLAILLAHHFPRARVDAADFSGDALAVAKINLDAHAVTQRVTLYQSDVFDAVPKRKYDVILSNPPYEPSAHVDAMPAEFRCEPRMALDGGADGLQVIRKLLRQAGERLKPEGLLFIEVGGLRETIDREFAALEPHWLPTEDGSDCVCVIHAQHISRK